MADKFDALMYSIADDASAAVDLAALKAAVTAENARARKRRSVLVRSLSAAAVFLVLAVAGGTVLFNGARGYDMAGAGTEELMYSATAEEDSAADSFNGPVEAPAPAALDEAPAAAAEAAAEAAPEVAPEVASEAAFDAGASGSRGAEDAQNTVALLLAQSNGTFYNVGLHAASDVVLTDCVCTVLPCDVAVLSPGQLYVAVLNGSLTGLYQASASEYVLIENITVTAEQLAAAIVALP